MCVCVCVLTVKTIYMIQSCDLKLTFDKSVLKKSRWKVQNVPLIVSLDMLLHKKLLLKLFINNKWFTLKFFKLLWNKKNCWLLRYWIYRDYYIYDIFRIISHINLLLPYQPEGGKARGLKWVEGWFGVWYEKCPIIIYLSYIFFFTICYFAFPSADNNFLILPSRLTNGLQFQL